MKLTRIALFVLCTAIAIGPLDAQEQGLINNAKTPHMKLKCVNLIDCQWTDGFWADKVKACHDIMIPHLGKLMDDPEIIHAYDNFRVAAGLIEGEFRGWSFTDGDFYKYVEALSCEYVASNDQAIDEKLDEIIAVIAKAQRDDGYIHTMIQIGHGKRGFLHEKEREFSSINGPFEGDGSHEFYNFGHLMTAACVHYRATGNRNFLDVAIKTSNLLYSMYKEQPQTLIAADWNPPHYMGLVEMYRTTGDKRFLEVAEFLVLNRGTVKPKPESFKGADHSQKRTPIRKEVEAVGHAGHGNYLFSGVVDVYSETGNKALLEAMDRIWQDVAKRKMYVTGATGAYHFGLSVNHDKVSEAYGKSYELPNADTYNETCANIGNAMWNWRMFLLDGEARFADIVELVFYNSALSGISLDGKHYFYTNPLQHLHDHPHATKDKGSRNPFMSVFCCPPNIIRTIAQMNNYAYTTSDEGVWVNLYGSNLLDTKLADGSELKLTQRSDYPWNGSVKISVEVPESNEFSMMLRIPGWVQEARLSVNGQAVEDKLHPGSFFALKRTWSTGDVVELNLPMTPQLIEANPLIEHDRNQVAVKRGPLVYCLESVDLPDGVGVHDVVIPAEIDLQPRFDASLLSGVVVLEGEADRVNNTDWSNQLYRPLSKGKAEPVSIRLIPYYAWSNRGPTDMTVWMPLDAAE